MQKLFYSGLKNLNPQTLTSRMALFTSKGGKQLSSLNAYHLPSSQESQNIIVFATNANCWQLSPKHYDYLRKTADVVLWNPGKFTPVRYQTDLTSVLKKMRRLYPEKTITILSRCASVAPVIGAAATLQDRKIHLVLDRGFGSATKLARLMSLVSFFPPVHRALQKHFECHGEELISQVPGNILFLHSPHDQIMHYGRHDLVVDLIRARGPREKDEVITLQSNDHWSSLDQKTYKKVHAFMGLGHRLDVSAFPTSSQLPHCCSRKVLPFLLHRFC